MSFFWLVMLVYSSKIIRYEKNSAQNHNFSIKNCVSWNLWCNPFKEHEFYNCSRLKLTLRFTNILCWRRNDMYFLRGLRKMTWKWQVNHNFHDLAQFLKGKWANSLVYRGSQVYFQGALLQGARKGQREFKGRRSGAKSTPLPDIVTGQEKPLMCFWPLNMHFAKIRSCYIRGFALNMFRGQRHIGGFSCPMTIYFCIFWIWPQAKHAGLVGWIRLAGHHVRTPCTGV